MYYLEKSKKKKIKYFSDIEIVEFISRLFNLKFEELISEKRSKIFIKPRFIAVYILREKNNRSFPRIAGILNRDHTSIIYAYRKIKKKIKKDPELKNEIEYIWSSIKENVSVENLPSVEKKEFQEKFHKNQKKFFEKENARKKIRINSLNKKRDEAIFRSWISGKTLEEIGSKRGLSRERIRQIVNRENLRKILEKEERGLEIDKDEFISHQKQNHQINLQQKRKEKEGPKLKKKKEVKRWSRYYTQCKKCGTRTIPHYKEGVCEKCYLGYERKNRNKIILEVGSKCESCGMDRISSFQKFNRDLYITKEDGVLCKDCFQKMFYKKVFRKRNKN
jgi:hypothetical protein